MTKLHDTLRKAHHIHQNKSNKNFTNDTGRAIGPTLQGFERGGSSITNALDRTIKDPVLEVPMHKNSKFR